MNHFFICLFVFLGITIVNVENSLANGPSSNSVLQANRMQVKPECRLEVGDAHLSSTLLKHRNVAAVKVNVRSICNVMQSTVRITLEIKKSQFPFDHTYGPFYNSNIPGQNSGMLVTLQDKYVICNNNLRTEWFGVASAKAIINGKWQIARKTQSEHKVFLPCGT